VCRLLAVCSVLLSASLAYATDLRVHVDIDIGAGVVPAAEAIVCARSLREAQRPT
jgi:hypothetical protein